MRKIFLVFKRERLAILTGFFIGTSYIPSWPWASLFCFVPLWIAWWRVAHHDDSLDLITACRKIFFSGWVAQFVLTLIGFHWITLTIHDFGLMPWPVAFLVLLIFCAVANIDIPLAGVAWIILHKKLKLKSRASLALMAILMALFESRIPTIFPWNYGYTWLWAKSPFAQNAELIGFQGLSSVLILLNLGVFLFWTYRKKKYLAITLALFLTLNLTGLMLLRSLPTPSAELKVVIAQGNIGNLEKAFNEHRWAFREVIFERYTRLTRNAIEQLAAPPDFVVWPETAYPYDMDQRRWSNLQNAGGAPVVYPSGADRLLNFANSIQSHLFLGGYGTSPMDEKVTNTFFVAEKNGVMQPDPYYKTILLAFGEYIPGANFFPKLQEIIPAGDFSRGPGPQAKTIGLDSGPSKFGPQICYESLFPEFSRELANQGAEYFVNLTNDSWYGTWSEPYQHLYMTLARAVEYRRPLIRATNTGISTVVLASGEVLEKSPMSKEWSAAYKVPYIPHPQATLYQKYPWLMNAVLIFMLGLIVLRKARLGSTE